eukprot:6193498-Pleurochrysis_carterae.AAC.3
MKKTRKMRLRRLSQPWHLPDIKQGALSEGRNVTAVTETAEEQTVDAERTTAHTAQQISSHVEPEMATEMASGPTFDFLSAPAGKVYQHAVRNLEQVL